ncbi:MAG: deoxyribodipyrimidine photo-lyase, partial [Boseongicola sp.]|nr:deoxyribodipyrimidine photo-lyase [Boseongicola sp.]
VSWGLAYHPDQIERDTNVKGALAETGIDAKSVSAHLIFEPWSVETKTGDFYKVYSPFWRAVKDRPVSDLIAAPRKLRAPELWPSSESPKDWKLDKRMKRGAAIVQPHICVGEEAALHRLDAFVETRIDAYKAERDFPAIPATSKLSENLAWGEISARTLWHRGMQASLGGAKGAEHFVKEVVWREFAYHLMWHTPHILSGNWREGWDAFPWNDDGESEFATAWKQGRTGIRFVDAAMREMYVTGHMHNRARMIVASYLTKHLMTHWRVGLKWFEDCLIDWDPASNAMGWQWAAGSGPDAAPYFRVFNPVTQLEKFDADEAYQNAWIAEGQLMPTETALSYFKAVPKSWNMSANQTYPNPIVTAETGRKRALEAYEARSF